MLVADCESEDLPLPPSEEFHKPRSTDEEGSAVMILKVSCLILLVSMPCHLAAQTDSIMSAHRIDEVEVVGVSKQNIYRNVSPVYTLSASDFHRLNVSDVSTALRRLPGITLRDYGGAGGMKTISVRGVGSQHSGVALGGLLLPEFMSGQIDFQQFQLSELSSLSLQIGTAVDIFQPARNFSKASVVSVNTADSTHSRAALVVGNWGL